MYGVKSGCSNRPHLRELPTAERVEEFSRHQLGFKGLREVHKTRAFRLVLLAGPRCRVGEHPVRILEEVVAEEKVRVGFNGFPPIRWYTICRGLVLTIENRHSTGRVLLGSPIARCGLDTRDPISQVEYSEDVRAQLTRSRNPCCNTTQPAKSSPSSVPSAFTKGRFIGVIMIPGSPNAH